MIISFFHNSRDNDPAQLTTNWDELASSLKQVRKTRCTVANCKRSECDFKDGPSWSAARYYPGKSRAVTNVIDVHALVIDIDHAKSADLPGISKYKRIVTSSHSDRPDDRCFRVVIAISRPIPLKDWYRFWGAAIKHLDIPADKQVKDPSRLFYLPSRPSDADYTYESHAGVELDVDKILASAPAVEMEILDDDYEVPDFKGAPSEDNLLKAVDLLGGAWPDAGRNTCQLALCGALARAGWPVELIADFVAGVCEVAHPGNGDHAKRVKSARASVTKVQNGEFVAGWPTVEEYVDPDTVRQAKEYLGLSGPRFDQGFVDAMKKASEYHDTIEGVGTRVQVTRDDVESALKAAKKRLGRSTNADKIKDGTLIGRALAGKPFTEHADEDADQALINGLKTVVKYAPRGTTTLVVAEYLTKSRPDIPLNILCDMIDKARESNIEERKAESSDEFETEFTGPRAGKPSASSQHNFEVALRKLNIEFYYDNFSRKKIIEKTIGEDLYREVVEDSHVNKIMFEMEQQFDFFPPKDKFYAYCDYKARENSFHPVLDYLDGLEPWDGENRLETWLINYGGAPDTPYVRAVSRLALIAAARRVRKPGCKFDEMLILEGVQGVQKSSALRTLCPNIDWFSDNFVLDGDSKKMIEQTAGKWIVEAGELVGLSAKDHNHMKQYLSSTHDEARMAYGRESQRHARQFILIGTTNDTQYLKDHTGARRYWPVKIQQFDCLGLASVRDQIWAEAAYLDKCNDYDEYIRLDPSLYADAAEEQAKRRVDNPVKIKLESYLGDLEGKILTSDVWKLLTEDPVPANNLTAQAAHALQELGWTKERYQVNGKRDYYYSRGDDSVTLVVVGTMNFGNLAVKPLVTDDSGKPAVKQVFGKTN